MVAQPETPVLPQNVESVAQDPVVHDYFVPPPTDLIFDDGIPLETIRHRTAMNALIRSVKHNLPRPDMFVGGNMFVYYSSRQVKNQDFRGPDFFAVVGVDGNPDRKGWVVWEEEGRFPDVIVEFLSPSTMKDDTGAKKTLYEQVFKTRDYFVFDPYDPDSLQGWHLHLDRGYQPLEPNDRGWLWCDTLQYWAGTWSGVVEDVETTWLRFYNPDGSLVLLPEESAQQRLAAAQQRLEVAQEQAERLAARLRELGVDPEQI